MTVKQLKNVKFKLRLKTQIKMNFAPTCGVCWSGVLQKTQSKNPHFLEENRQNQEKTTCFDKAYENY